MRIGSLRHEITIERATEGRNAFGEVTRSWQPLYTTWAEVAPLRQQELVEAKQVDERATHRVVLRYDPNNPVNSMDRINFKGRIIEIGGVVNELERDAVLVVVGTESD